MYTTRVDWEPLRILDASTLGATRLPIGGPLVHPSYKLKLVNNSNVLVTISINGTSDVDVAPANSYWIYDENVTSNHEGTPAGTQIYVLSSTGAPGTGNIYLVSQFLLQL